MKKAIALVTLIVSLFCCLQVSASASGGDVAPCFENTSTTQSFLAFQDDVAIVTVMYTCYPNIPVSVKITTTLQKKFMLFWWTDLTTWTDYSSNTDDAFEHNYSTSSGTHRILVTYEITNLNTGVTDVIENEIEKKN